MSKKKYNNRQDENKARVNALKKKYNVKKIYSFSEVDSYIKDKYSYYLKRIAKEKSDREGADGYLLLGSICHDILEKYYQGEIKIHEMADLFDEKYDDVRMMDSKFILSDDKKNDSAMNKYYECIYSFFRNFEKLKGKTLVEKGVEIKVGDYIFNGYIDCMNVGEFEGKLLIQDFKTSTIYKGDKIKSNANQLILYAIGVCQMKNLPFDKVEIGWNFIKYINVEIEQLNGKKKSVNWLRSEVGEKSASYVRKFAKKLGYDEFDTEKMVDELNITNDLTSLPDDIYCRFATKDCHVSIDFNEDVVNEFLEKFARVVDELENDRKEYEKTKDDMIYYKEIDKKDERYYYNLCEYSSNLHKPFADYIEAKEKERNIDLTNAVKDVNINGVETYSNSYLDGIGDDVDFDEIFK